MFPRRARRMVPSVAPKSCRRIKPDACGEVASDQTTRHLRRAPFQNVVGAASDDFTGSGEPRIERTCLLQYGVDRRRSAMFIPQKLPKNRKWEVVLSLSSCFHWRALRESNPCFRRERAASWTARRRARTTRERRCGKRATYKEVWFRAQSKRLRSNVLMEPDLFGKPVSTLGTSPRAGFFRIMLVRQATDRAVDLKALEARPSPVPGIGHRHPGLLRRQRRAFLQQFDRMPVG